MNNQVKPTDTQKLLHWIESKLEATRLTPAWFAYREMQKKVLLGAFETDTPPVPTIKLGDKVFACPNCQEASTAGEWNLATSDACGTHEITLIESKHAEESFFTCPKCGSEEDYGLLVVVE
ncbi:hypothetical protein [Paenibacillus campinasensis]|uniref:Uncharacterized protein n=1 Tax=Paenibacillus campinasensis TaxID=66347 RepID=A0A268EI81_9BACL|nr:hypothetical protein [Paenibacillus campinasensis]PAD72847.1 hypothetical protein CHH67_21305 [Paenibacillus campinasensis]